jgi:hypothetical protein
VILNHLRSPNGKQWLALNKLSFVQVFLRVKLPVVDESIGPELSVYRLSSPGCADWILQLPLSAEDKRVVQYALVVLANALDPLSDHFKSDLRDASPVDAAPQVQLQLQGRAPQPHVQFPGKSPSRGKHGQGRVNVSSSFGAADPAQLQDAFDLMFASAYAKAQRKSESSSQPAASPSPPAAPVPYGYAHMGILPGPLPAPMMPGSFPAPMMPGPYPVQMMPSAYGYGFGPPWPSGLPPAFFAGAAHSRAQASSAGGADGSADAQGSKALMPAGQSGGGWPLSWGQPSSSDN